MLYRRNEEREGEVIYRGNLSKPSLGCASDLFPLPQVTDVTPTATPASMP